MIASGDGYPRDPGTKVLPFAERAKVQESGFQHALRSIVVVDNPSKRDHGYALAVTATDDLI